MSTHLSLAPWPWHHLFAFGRCTQDEMVGVAGCRELIAWTYADATHRILLGFGKFLNIRKGHHCSFLVFAMISLKKTLKLQQSQLGRPGPSFEPTWPSCSWRDFVEWEVSPVEVGPGCWHNHCIYYIYILLYYINIFILDIYWIITYIYNIIYIIYKISLRVYIYIYIYIYIHIYIYTYIYIYIYILFIVYYIIYIYIFHTNLINMNKGSLLRKLPSYRRLSWPAFSSSWQPHHHLYHYVSHIIMPTTSASGQERGNSALKTFSGAKPCIYSGKVACVVAAGARLDRGKLSTKSAQDCGEGSISNWKNV